LLASLEVSTRLSSVALFDLEKGQSVGETFLSNDQESSVTLLPGLEKLLQQNQLKAQAITALAVALGPGSFTGIRIGIATAEGFAMPQGLPVYGVPTLDGLAENLQAAGQRGEALCLIDAMRGECFAARYSLDEAGFHELEPATIWTLEKIAQNIGEKTWVVGPGALRYETDIKKLSGTRGQWVAADLHRPSAFSLARIAYRRWKGGERPGLESLRPLYIRLPSVEEKKP